MAIIRTSELLDEFTNQLAKNCPELPEYCATEGLDGWLEAPARVDQKQWLVESIFDMLDEEECYDVESPQTQQTIIKAFDKSFRKVTGVKSSEWYEEGIDFIVDHHKQLV